MSYIIADMTLRSLGGAHDANMTCIAGNVTPPPIPSPTRIKIIAPAPQYAMGGDKSVQRTFIATENNMTHLAENFSATCAPGICETK